VGFEAIARHRGSWPLRWLCDMSDLACSAFYAWLERPKSERSRINTQLSAAIRANFAESDRTYVPRSSDVTCAPGEIIAAFIGSNG